MQSTREKRTVIVPFRLTPTEWGLLSRVAKAEGRPVANLIRHMALQAARQLANGGQGGAHA